MKGKTFVIDLGELFVFIHTQLVRRFWVKIRKMVLFILQYVLCETINEKYSLISKDVQKSLFFDNNLSQNGYRSTVSAELQTRHCPTVT